MASENPRPRAKEKACDRAIQKTLAYSAVFNYPVSKFQLYTFLRTRSNFEEEFFEKSLRRQVKKGHVKARDGKYYLPQNRPVSWNLRDKYTKDLLGESKLGFSLLNKIPWIKMLAVTGAVASNNAGKDDDIDIFIVTQKNRVWLTRFFTYVILKIIDKYAQGKNNQRKFCCNLFVDETKIKWPEDKQNAYIAYEIASMHPIIDRTQTYFRFLKQNDWIFSYFKNYHITFPEKLKKLAAGSFWVDRLEDLARKFQLNYMKSKKTTEVTTKHLIHFNNHDHTETVLQQFKELAEE